jgi:hypothetical protein
MRGKKAGCHCDATVVSVTIFRRASNRGLAGTVAVSGEPDGAISGHHPSQGKGRDHCGKVSPCRGDKRPAEPLFDGVDASTSQLRCSSAAPRRERCLINRVRTRSEFRRMRIRMLCARLGVPDRSFALQVADLMSGTCMFCKFIITSNMAAWATEWPRPDSQDAQCVSRRSASGRDRS